jgi:hypothetical protein
MIRNVLLLSLVVLGPVLRGQVRPEAAVGVVVPQADTRTATPANSAAGVMLGLRIPLGKAESHRRWGVALRPRVEGVWGSSDYTIGDQRVRVDSKAWVAGSDLCVVVPWFPSAHLGVFGGAGYARFSNTLVGIAPLTKTVGRVAWDLGMESLPLQAPGASLGGGVRLLHIPKDADAVAYDSVGIYALLRF